MNEDPRQRAQPTAQPPEAPRSARWASYTAVVVTTMLLGAALAGGGPYLWSLGRDYAYFDDNAYPDDRPPAYEAVTETLEQGGDDRFHRRLLVGGAIGGLIGGGLVLVGRPRDEQG